MQVSKNKIFSIINYCIFGLLLYIIINIAQNKELQAWIDIVSVILGIMIIIQIIIMRKLQLNIISLIGFFLAFTYIFHFGNVILLSTALKEFELGRLVLRYVEEEVFRDAVMYCFYFIYLLFLGVIFAANHKRNISLERNINTETFNLKVLKFIGWILFLIGIPAFLYVTYKEVYVAFTVDYKSTLKLQQDSIPSSVNFLSTMMNVGISLLLIGYKKNIQLAKIILLVGVLLQALSTLSGGRGLPTITIVLFIYIYHRFVKKFNISNVITFSFIAYIGLGFLSSIATIRDYGMNVEFLFETLITNLTSENIILLTLNEFGGTLLTPEIAMNSIPREVEPGYGLVYINAFLNLIGVNIGEVHINSFVDLINIGAMGGSYIAETYYNFLYSGLILAVIIGFIVTKVSNKIENIIFDKKYLTIGYYLTFFIGVLWWVRDSFYYLVKISLAGALLYFILQMLTKYLLFHFSKKNKLIDNKLAIRKQ